MADDLEKKVEGFWPQKFAEFDKLDAEGVRNYCLHRLRVLHASLSTPKDWFDGKPSSAHAHLEDLSYVAMYLSQNPEKAEALYKTITGQEAKEKGAHTDKFVRFFVGLLPDLYIVPPGDKVTMDGEIVWARLVRDRIMFSMYMLEKGPMSDFYERMSARAKLVKQKTELEAAQYK